MLTPGPAIALRAAYVAQLRALFVEPSQPLLDAASPQPPASDALAARAELFVQTSQSLGELMRTSLASGNRAEQQLVELDLLTHAAVGFESARGLLASAPPSTGLDSALLDSPRSVGTTPIQGSLDQLADQLSTGAPGVDSVGLLDAAPAAAAAPAGDVEQIRQQLIQQAGQAVDSITSQVVSVVTAGVQDVLLLNGPTILAGVKLLGGQAQALLDESLAALAGIVRRLAASAISLLAQSLDSVLALVGVNPQARAQVGTWLDQIRSQLPNPSAAMPIVTPLVHRILATDAIKHDVEHAFSGSAVAVPADRLGRASSAVEKLPTSYEAIAKRITQVLSIVTLVRVAPIVSTPQGQVVVAAVLTGLVGYALYSGYCHVDTGRISFNERFGFDIPERTVGVRATVMQTVSSATSD